MIRDLLFLTGVTMETRELKVERFRCVRRTGDSERLFPQLGLCWGTQSSPHRTGLGNLVTECEVRAYLTDTHTAGDKCISLYKQLNAINPAARHPGSSPFGPPYQKKLANTHACGSHMRPPLLQVWDSCNDRELSSKLGATLPELYFQKKLQYGFDVKRSWLTFFFFFSNLRLLKVSGVGTNVKSLLFPENTKTCKWINTVKLLLFQLEMKA